MLRRSGATKVLTLRLTRQLINLDLELRRAYELRIQLSLIRLHGLSECVDEAAESGLV